MFRMLRVFDQKEPHKFTGSISQPTHEAPLYTFVYILIGRYNFSCTAKGS